MRQKIEKQELDEKLQNKNNNQMIWKVLSEFCDHSTIHGVRYFTELRRHWTERSVFLVHYFKYRFCFHGFFFSK